MTSTTQADQHDPPRTHRHPRPRQPDDHAGCADRRGERGSASAQLVLLTPLLVLFILFFVGLGRETHARALVNDAAAQAARAATLNYLTPSAATTAAEQNANAALAQAGVSCAHQALSVDTGNDHPGGSITVTLNCQTDLADVIAAGFPGSVTLTGTATAPIDPYVPATGSGP